MYSDQDGYMVTARCVMNGERSDVVNGRQGGHSNEHVHVLKMVARDY